MYICIYIYTGTECEKGNDDQGEAGTPLVAMVNGPKGQPMSAISTEQACVLA